MIREALRSDYSHMSDTGYLMRFNKTGGLVWIVRIYTDNENASAFLYSPSDWLVEIEHKDGYREIVDGNELTGMFQPRLWEKADLEDEVLDMLDCKCC